MRIVVLPVEEVHVVRRDDAYAELPAELQSALHDGHLAVVQVDEVVSRRHRDVVARLDGLVQHHLERIVVAEQVLVPFRDALRLVHPPRRNRRGNLARDAGGRAVDPLVVLLEQRVVDPGALVESVDVRLGYQLDEVVVADEVLGVQAEVVALLVLVAAFVVSRRGDVRLASEDRLHVDARQFAVVLLLLGAALVVERLQREQIAVVRYGQGAHAKLARAFHERDDLALSVKQRICRVKMKMDKI